MRTATVAIVLFGITGLAGFGLGRLTRPPEPVEPRSSIFGSRDSTANPRVGSASVVPATYREREAKLPSGLGSLDGIDLDGSLDQTITGTVTDVDGAPVSYVELILRFRGTPEPMKADAKKVSIERYVETSAQLYRLRRDRTRRASTDGDGKFEFTEVGKGPYRLAAIDEDYVLRSNTEGKGLYSISGGDIVEAMAVPCGRVEVSVTGLSDSKDSISFQFDPVDENGDPLQAEPGARAPSSTVGKWRSDDPVLTIPEGFYRVKCQPGRYALDLEDDSPLLVESVFGTTSTLVVPLARRYEITGLIYQGDGVTLVKEGNVQLVEGDVMVPAADQYGRNQVQAVSQAWVDRGAFKFQGQKAGTYTIMFGRSWMKIDDRLVVELTDDMDIALTLPEGDPARTLEVLVRGPGGKVVEPRPSFNMVEEFENGGTNWVQVQVSSVSRDMIQYQLSMTEVNAGSNRADGETKPGRHYLDVQAQGYGTKRVEVFPGTTQSYEIEFEEPGMVEVSLEGFDQNAYRSKLMVQLVADGGGVENERWGRRTVGEAQKPGRDGTARLGPAAPGAYFAEVVVESSRWNMTPIARVPVQLSTGVAVATLRIPPLYEVSVTLPEGSGSEWVSLAGLDDATFNSSLNAKAGVARFDAVPVGRYRFSMNSQAGQHMDLEVRGPTNLAFEEAVVDRLWVTITSAEGTLAKAGLQDGDQILSIDDNSVEGVRGRFVLMAATQKPEVALDIIRGGQQLRLSVPGKSLGWFGGKPGGRIEAGSSVRP